ncbi:MAG: FAD-dependent oxidoreductase, partial [Mycobacterium sp.]
MTTGSENGSQKGLLKGIVIVGGGLAAARTAEQLRRSDYTGRITIVSDEVHLPYDRPPLS